jgi:NitT/TauT family transport system substrate-binding protein
MGNVLKFAITAATVVASAGTASALEKVKFATNWLAQANHGGYYQALADGTYEKFGLDVEILQGGPQVNNRGMLAAGKLDFLMAANLLLPFDAARNGIPTKAVAAHLQKDPQCIMSHKGAYAGWEDLTTAPAILLAKDAQFSFWQWMIKSEGFSDEQLRPYGFNLAAFLEDETVVQQCYVTSEPVYAAREGAQTDVYLLADYGWDTYSTLVEARTDMIENNPEIVQGFIDASAIGWYNFLYNDPSAGIAAIIASNPELTDASIRATITLINDRGLVDSGEALTMGIGALSQERVESFYNMAVENGIIEAGALNISDAVDYRFVNKGIGMELKP